MGISIEQYRQRIGCFRILGSLKGIKCEGNLKQADLKDFRTAIR